MVEYIDVVGYEGLYKINSEGNVFSVKNNKILKPVIHKTGYFKVNLCKNKKAKSCDIHKLMQRTFLKKDGYVDHINNIKTDNKLSNLRIVSGSQNSMNRKCKGYSVQIILDEDNEEVEYYRASIMKNGKKFTKSSFNLQVVLKWRVCMEILHFREFANRINATKIVSS